jgi:hypothetical protein
MKALAASSVIPLCACGGSVAQQVTTVAGMAFDAGSDSHNGYPDSTFYGVAQRAFDSGIDTGIYGVAQRAFDSGIDTGIIGTVAACCFDGSFGVAADAFTPDVGFIVAKAGFDGSVDSGSDAGS